MTTTCPTCGGTGTLTDHAYSAACTGCSWWCTTHTYAQAIDAIKAHRAGESHPFAPVVLAGPSLPEATRA